jgi:DNA repair protein SbcD/Mre11
MTLRLAHFSDSHLGYEAYPALSAHGNNQRGEDIVRSFQAVTSDITGWDPDLVIHAGDVGERPKIGVNYMLVAQRRFYELTKRPDGRRRPVIVIAGNHDLPRSRKERCWLEILSQIPDVHVVCYSYEVIDLGGRGYGEEYEGVFVHALAHDALKEVDFDMVMPIAGKSNILTSHGVAAGSELFTRSLGREYAVPSEVLARDWVYVALGHFHKRGPVSIGARPDPRIWYSGSSENISFRDLRENGTARGYLRVTLGERLDVTSIDLPIRRMLRLPVVEGAGKSPQEIEELLLSRIKAEDLTGAIIGQFVEGVTRDVWSLVDVAKVKAAAKEALHYEVTVHHARTESTDEVARELGDLAGLVRSEVETSVAEEYQAGVLTLSKFLLGSVLAVVEPVKDEVEEGEVGSGDETEKTAHAAESEPTPEEGGLTLEGQYQMTQALKAEVLVDAAVDGMLGDVTQAVARAVLQTQPPRKRTPSAEPASEPAGTQGGEGAGRSVAEKAAALRSSGKRRPAKKASGVSVQRQAAVVGRATPKKAAPHAETKTVTKTVTKAATRAGAKKTTSVKKTTAKKVGTKKVAAKKAVKSSRKVAGDVG